MKKINSTLLVCILSLQLSASVLERSCKDLGGVMFKSMTCPMTGVERKGNVCFLNETVFYNGCSASVPGYKDFFFPACFLHDLCYHHEPTSNGFSRKYCDRKFKKHLYSLCLEHEDHDDCKSSARIFYRAVRSFGKKSFICSNSKFNYPKEL